jgi:hypothetical protein
MMRAPPGCWKFVEPPSTCADQMTTLFTPNRDSGVTICNLGDIMMASAREVSITILLILA